MNTPAPAVDSAVALTEVLIAAFARDRTSPQLQGILAQVAAFTTFGPRSSRRDATTRLARAAANSAATAIREDLAARRVPRAYSRTVAVELQPGGHYRDQDAYLVAGRVIEATVNHWQVWGQAALHNWMDVQPPPRWPALVVELCAAADSINRTRLGGGAAR